jgi:hypothetical protein
MHLEELALSTGGLGGARRELGARMCTRDREWSIHVDESIAKCLPQAAKDRPQASAEWTQEVLVTDDDDRIISRRIADVIA